MTRRSIALVCLAALLTAALTVAPAVPVGDVAIAEFTAMAPPEALCAPVVPPDVLLARSIDLVQLPRFRGPPSDPVRVEKLSKNRDREGSWDAGTRGSQDCCST